MLKHRIHLLRVQELRLVLYRNVLEKLSRYEYCCRDAFSLAQECDEQLLGFLCFFDFALVGTIPLLVLLSFTEDGRDEAVQEAVVTKKCLLDACADRSVMDVNGLAIWLEAAGSLGNLGVVKCLLQYERFPKSACHDKILARRPFHYASVEGMLNYC